jgi:catechol 2,3-dioxygenase-like lactoylglutathione lyase family enzyme
MHNTQIRGEAGTQSPIAGGVEMKLEVVVLPVSDVDRAKRFYGGLGWRLDADFATGPDFRVAQLSFRDPDGNGWLLQEIKTRLPGRVWPTAAQRAPELP